MNLNTVYAGYTNTFSKFQFDTYDTVWPAYNVIPLIKSKFPCTEWSFI